MKQSLVATSILLLLLSVLLNSAYAQPAVKGGFISGTLKDGEGKYVNNATVTLFHLRDSVQVTEDQFYKGSISDGEGNFTFSGVDAGYYLLAIQHTGYEILKKVFKIEEAEKKEFNLITLTSQVKGLQGVTVIARKPLIEQTDDKIVFNVENDPLSKTETALDILRKTPFVAVDGEGNIQVNGKSSFKVLLDGKETSLFAQNAKEALRGFPGAVITKIEVITSPSAKYDAEGVGGIINIITKKKIAGFNGSVSLNYETTKDKSGSVTLNAKMGNIGASLFYTAFSRNGLKEGFYSDIQPLTPAAFSRRRLTGNRLIDMFRNTGNAEINWQKDSLNTISVYGNVSGGNFDTYSQQSVLTEMTGIAAEPGTYILMNNQQFPGFMIGSDYVRKFKDNKEREFSMRINGDFSKANTFLNSQQYSSSNERFLINNSYAKNSEFTFQSDYIQPLKNNKKIEVGVKAIIRRASSDFESMIKYNASKEYEADPMNTDFFNYQQNVYSTYGSYNFKINKASFRLGVRIEHTETDGNFITSAKKVSQDYTSILPNLQASFKPGKNTIVLNYTERLQRPYINSLNPFINNNDSLNIFYGNPELRPQTLRSLSLQQRIPAGKSFIGITLSGSYSNDMIVQFASFDKTTGITETTSGNIGKEFQAGLAVNLTSRINNEWNIFFNGNLRYNNIKNRTIKDMAFEGITGNGNINSSYKINKKLSASAYFNIRFPQVTYQVTSNTHLWYGAGVTYLLFKDKVSASMQFSGVFQKNFDYQFITENDDFSITNGFINPYRRMKLGISWNFGTLKENVSKKKGIVNDDLIN